MLLSAIGSLATTIGVMWKALIKKDKDNLRLQQKLDDAHADHVTRIGDLRDQAAGGDDSAAAEGDRVFLVDRKCDLYIGARTELPHDNSGNSCAFADSRRGSYT